MPKNKLFIYTVHPPYQAAFYYKYLVNKFSDRRNFRNKAR